MTASTTTIRRANVLSLFKEFVKDREQAGQTDFKAQGDFAGLIAVHPAMWSQIKRSRPIGDRLARQIEHRCGKPTGWLDEERELIEPTEGEARFLDVALQAYRSKDADGRRRLRQEMQRIIDWQPEPDPEQVAPAEPAPAAGAAEEPERPMIKRRHMGGHRDVSAAGWLWQVVRSLLSTAEERELGSACTCQAAAVFAAFTFEAHMNAIGPELVREWTNEHEGMPTCDKFRVIAASLGAAPDMGRHPFQTLTALFAFRNDLAHGRDERKLVDKPVPLLASAKDLVRGVKSGWDRYTALADARSACDDVLEVVNQLQAWSGKPVLRSGPFGIESGAYCVRVSEEERPVGRSRKKKGQA